MGKILQKEMKLSASVLSYLFICFGLMFMLPGYPVLCGVFFVTLGIFQSFQNARETNDILFSALLPIAKKDVVKGKFIFVCFIELCSLLVMGVCTVLRMTALSQSAVYRNNVLMNANLFALAVAFVMFGLYNSLFVGGFFKTAYKFGKPFVIYIIASFLTLGVAETLHHVPGLEFFNAFGKDHLMAQLLLLAMGVAIYVFTTWCSYKVSCKRFEKLDL